MGSVPIAVIVSVVVTHSMARDYICNIRLPERLNDSCEHAINRFPLMIVGNVGRTFTAQDSFSLPVSFAGHTNATYTYNAKSEEFIESGM